MGSSAIPFAGARLDRVGERRSDTQWLAQARADPAARAVLIGKGGASHGTVALDGAEPLALLGVDEDGASVWVVAAGEDAALTDLRTLAASVDGPTAGLVAYAAAMAHFHRSQAFCGRDGTPTVAAEGGHARVCENGHSVHPRTDAVVIMLVCDGRDRVLLGRQPSWPPRRFSALAGFVEPGEDLATAVRREVLEESTVVAGEVRYVDSQPWPFPTSLMLGFHCDYVSGEPKPGDGELEAARWFTREEIAAAAEVNIDFSGEQPPGEGLILPPHLAIARHLVERWLAL